MHIDVHDENTQLEILYQDEHCIAIHKPSQMLVHRTEICPDRVVALQLLRDQIGRHVHPVHRLDRATSGVLIFTFEKDTLAKFKTLFEKREVQKTYICLCRGWANESGRIDNPLKVERNIEKVEAISDYKTLHKTEMPWPCGPYETSRYSLIEVKPHHGRMHQIRRHMNHIAHPIIGDTAYGDGRHNTNFREKADIHRMMLQAIELSFIHPYSQKEITIKSKPDQDFTKAARALGWSL